MPVQCKDCKQEWWNDYGTMLPESKCRPIVPDSGMRCATHWRAEKKRRRAAAHERYVGKTYQLKPGEYQKLLDLQGGRCPLCLRANGATRRLSVDHDHACCPGSQSCGHCIRGALCRPCNDLLGHARDSIAFFERCIEYLRNPPAGLLAREAIQRKWDRDAYRTEEGRQG